MFVLLKFSLDNKLITKSVSIDNTLIYFNISILQNLVSMCDGLVRHRDFRSLPSDTTIWSGVSQLVECQMNE